MTSSQYQYAEAGYWAEASERRPPRIAAQGQQHSRSLPSHALPILPPVPLWDRSLQANPDLNSSPPPQSQSQFESQFESQWLPSHHSAGALQPSGYATPFRSFYQPPLDSPFAETPSIPRRLIMSPEQRVDLPRASLCPTNAGSEDSQTLRSSTLSRDPSQDRTLNRSFDTHDDMNSSFLGQSAVACPPISVFSIDEYAGTYSGTGLASSQYDCYPDILQNGEQEMPWSSLNTSLNQSSGLNKRYPTSQMDATLLGPNVNGPIGQYAPPATPYPSQIPSPITETPWHVNEADLIYSSSASHEFLLNGIDGSCRDGDPRFFRDHIFPKLPVHDQDPRESSVYISSPTKRHKPSSNDLQPPADCLRNSGTTYEAQLVAKRTTDRNKNKSNEVDRAFNSTPYFAQEVLIAPNNLLLDKMLAPTRASDRIWKHETVSESGPQQLHSQNPRGEIKNKKMGRKGPLEPDSKRRVRQVRKDGACWQCWYSKTSCSLDPICDRCKRFPVSLCCNKNRLYDYVNLFFDQLVVSRRYSQQVQRQIDEDTNGFTDTSIEISLSAGRYPPMRIKTHEFVPKPDRADVLLSQYYAPPDVHSPLPVLERVYSPPLGIKDDGDNIKLRDTCSEYINDMIKESRFSKEATDHDSSLLLRKVYDAVNCYRIENADSMLRKAIVLYAMHFFMSRVITFTKESAKKVVTNFKNPTQLSYGRRISSKLLTNQIKQEMHCLQKALTREILQDLDKELRRKSKNSWAICFGLIVILIMCIEAAQIAADGFVVKTMIENNSENVLSRDDAIEIARSLEDKLFKDFLHHFHLIYQSREDKKHKGFNPIRDGVQIDTEHGIDENTVDFVNRMRQIIGDNQEVLEEKAKNPDWEYKGDPLAAHYRFRQQNSGRLLAKFLKSFC